MENIVTKINISSCFLPKYILDEMILQGVIDTPRMEFLKKNDSDVKSYPQEFHEVSVSEVNLKREGLEKLSEAELAQHSIILVKRYKVANKNMLFHPQTRRNIEGNLNNYAWIKIEKLNKEG